MAKQRSLKLQGYGITNPLQNIPPNPIISNRAPTTGDTGKDIGTLWINQSTGRIYSLASISAGSATWVELTSGSVLPEIETLTGNSGGAVGPDGAANVNIVGSGTINVVGNPGTNTLTITDTGGGAAISKYIVDADGSGDYTTIQAALDAANTAALPATVVVRPGTYTENLTLYDQIDIYGNIQSGVTIIGVHTPPASGRVAFQDLTLQSATDIFNSAAAGTTDITVEDCLVNITNGYLFNLLNWTGALAINSCANNGTNDGFINNTGGSSIAISDSSVGAGTGNTFVMSNGIVEIVNSEISCPGTFGGTASISVDGNVLFRQTMTTADTATVSILNSSFSTGATASINHGSSNALTLSEVSINSSNNPVISGTGPIVFGNVSYLDGKNIAAGITQNYAAAIDRITPYVVGSTGNFSTIQAALDAANASGVNQVVHVQAGTYTESLTLYDGIDIKGAIYPNTTITGVHTPPASGSFMIQNCTLTNATDIFNSAVAGTTNITVEDCFVNVTNGYLFNLLNWTGNIAINSCGASGTNDGFINNTGGSAISISDSSVGVGTGNSFVMSNGTVELVNSEISCPGTFGGTATVSTDGNILFRGTVTTADTATVTILNSIFLTGATAAISHGSSNLFTISECTIDSSNNPVIAGTGPVDIGNISFVDGKNIASAITQTYSSSVGRISPYVVGSTGNFSTIQSAIDAANSAGGDTVYIQPGDYTENLTLYDKVNLRAFPGNYGSNACGVLATIDPTVNVIGSLTLDTSALPTNSYNTIENIQFTPASGNVITFTANGGTESILRFINSRITVSQTGSYAFTVDGFPTVIMKNSEVLHPTGINGNLINFPGALQFWTLIATNCSFRVNDELANSLPTASFIQIYLDSCFYQSMMDLSGAASGTLNLTAQDCTFEWAGLANEPLINYGSNDGFIQISQSKYNSGSGPFSSSTSVSAASTFRIKNTLFTDTYVMDSNCKEDLYGCTFATESAQAITMNSAQNISINECTIDSTNNPAVGGTGAGTINIGSITFPNNSSFAGTLTLGGKQITSGDLTLLNRTANAVPVYGTSGALSEIGPLTNGQLVIGSTGAAPVAAGLTSTGGTITITPGAGTINLEGSAGAAISKYIVDADGTGDYTTIQAALNAANAAAIPATVIVRPGTYTENLTLYDQIDIYGNIQSGVTVVGVHTPPASGRVAFQDLTLQSATDIFNSAVAGSTNITVEDCLINVTNGYLFNLLNWTGTLAINSCATIGTNDGFVNNTGGATIEVSDSAVGAGSANAFTMSNGTVEMVNSEVLCPGTFGGSASVSVDGNMLFRGTITTANTATVSILNSIISTGANAAISHGSSNPLTLSDLTIDSSNATPIGGAGAGAIGIGNVSFLTNSGIASALTVGYERVVGRASPYVVGSSGNFATIQAAIDAASNASGNHTVYVQPGTYTENLSIPIDTEIVGVSENPDNQEVKIIGVHTPPLSGNISFGNVCLQTASDVINSLVVGSVNMYFNNCEFIVNGGRIIEATTWTGTAYIKNCKSSGTNDGVLNNTSTGTLIVTDSVLGFPGTSMICTGTLSTVNSTLAPSISLNGSTPSGFTSSNIIGNVIVSASATLIGVDTQFSAGITTSNTATLSLYGCKVSNSGAAAVTQGSSSAMTLLNTVIETSNNPAIAGTGAGAVKINGIDFPLDSNVAGTVTLSNASQSVSGGLGIVEGTNAQMGVATLVAGTVTVNTTRVTANSRIFLTHQNSSGTAGFVKVSARVAGTSFTITSSSGTDTSDIGWHIVEPK